MLLSAREVNHFTSAMREIHLGWLVVFHDVRLCHAELPISVRAPRVQLTILV